VSSSPRDNESATARAARHDADGDHDAAVDVLAAATQRGDLEAMTQLGRRLLVGDRAPALPRDGTGLLLDAFKQGNADAAARLAVLTALGCYVKRSVADAIDLLVGAAERGSTSARGQLETLSADAELARSARASSSVRADLWRRLAQSVDVAGWAAAPPAQTLNESPLVRCFRGFATPAVCDWLIERARGRLHRARVYDTHAGADVENDNRTNTIAEFNLAEADVVHVALQVRMAAACGIPLEQMEAPAVLHYEVGEQIGNHFDFIDPQVPNYADEIEKRGERVVTFLVYLNDSYEGGETDFPKLGVRHKGASGEGLFFVNALANGGPDTRMLHAGRPPSRGEKWIVSQFIRNRRTLPAV
jgi:prolyl 4-hydroxylase